MDSNDSFNSNLLIEPGQDISSSYPPSSNPVTAAGGGTLPPHHLPPGDHLPRFPNPGAYMGPPPRKSKKLQPGGHESPSHKLSTDGLQRLRLQRRGGGCRLFRVMVTIELGSCFLIWRRVRPRLSRKVARRLSLSFPLLLQMTPIRIKKSTTIPRVPNPGLARPVAAWMLLAAAEAESLTNKSL